ncbi:MAG: ABC transporter permease [Bryobacteraceae bacterium]|nr:ABC transporter permease [Bryobacteraceae bacterium]
MKAYLAHIRTTMKLTMRDRIVLFFNYLLPLLFFIVFAQSFGADRGGAISQVITMVLIMGVLGSGFFGAGLRAVQERELNILRRFKVAPITPLPLLVSSLVTGVLAYLPSLAMILLVSRFYYGMPWPERWLSLTLLLTLGLVAFRSIGLIIASVVNSMQESQIIIQLMYLPMLFLSGATFPVGMLPHWLQMIAQFMPATYLYTGLNGILVRKESLAENWLPVTGMLITTLVAIFLAVKLFRWEKDEKLPARAKLWIAAVMLPFLLMGGWQLYRQDNIVKAKTLFREMRRNRALLIRGPRIFTGERVISAGGLLIRDGRIAEVYETVPPEKDAKAEVMEAAGKTLLPGLIDARVHLAMLDGGMERKLAAYLYCGVVAVRSVGDPPELRAVRAKIASGELLGAEAVADASPRFDQPSLSAAEARVEASLGKSALLDLSLVLQVAPEGMIEAARKLLKPDGRAPGETLEAASDKLLRAWKAGLPLLAGTDSGIPLLVHGPAIHRELQLWVKAGIPPHAALQAATSANAQALGFADRTGRIRKGLEASFLVVDGNPLEEIAATERISSVFFRGERVDRASLFKVD